MRQNGASERKAPLAAWGYHCSLHGKGYVVGWGRERGEGAGEREGGTYPFALVFLPPLPPPFAPVKQAK